MRDTLDNREAAAGRVVLEQMARLPDEALLANARTLTGRERRLTAELVALLAEIDARGLCHREGYSSLFSYCREALLLSEHEAYGRIEAARAARRFPIVLDLLREGAVTLTAVSLLAPHLTADNHAAVLESARGKRKTQVQEIVARLHPAPDVPATIRKLPGPPATLRSPADPVGPASDSTAERSRPPATTAASLVTDTRPCLPPAPPPLALSPDRYKYQLTIDEETRDLLVLAKDMLRHAHPAGDDASLLKRALQLLVADLERKRLGAARPRKPKSAPGTRKAGTAPAVSRHIPAAVKRAVHRRDRGSCAFVGRSGRRCGERGFLELHHVKPYAVGGQADARNIELRCRRHNQYEARVYFARPDGGTIEWTRAGP